MRIVAAVRVKRVVMESLRGEEGKVASHFGGESSNIRCGKSETCGYIRNGRRAVKMKTDGPFSGTARHEKRLRGIQEYENGTEHGAADWYLLRRTCKRARAATGCGTYRERVADRRCATIRRFG